MNTQPVSSVDRGPTYKKQTGRPHAILTLNVKRYTHASTIQRFRNEETRILFETGKSRHFSAFVKAAERKLQQLDAAEILAFLASPPGNKLEALQGERKGQHSIRINSQFRVCFRWTQFGPEDAEITDYH